MAPSFSSATSIIFAIFPGLRGQSSDKKPAIWKPIHFHLRKKLTGGSWLWFRSHKRIPDEPQRKRYSSETSSWKSSSEMPCTLRGYRDGNTPGDLSNGSDVSVPLSLAASYVLCMATSRVYQQASYTLVQKFRLQSSQSTSPNHGSRRRPCYFPTLSSFRRCSKLTSFQIRTK